MGAPARLNRYMRYDLCTLERAAKPWLPEDHLGTCTWAPEGTHHVVSRYRG